MAIHHGIHRQCLENFPSTLTFSSVAHPRPSRLTSRKCLASGFENEWKTNDKRTDSKLQPCRTNTLKEEGMEMQKKKSASLGAKLPYQFPSFPEHIDHQRLHAKHTQTCFASFSTRNNARIIDAKTSITGQSPSLYHHLPHDHQSLTHPAMPQFLLVVLLDLLPSVHWWQVVCNWRPSTCSGNKGSFPDGAHNNSAMASRSKPPKPVVAKLSIFGKPVDPRPTCIGDALKINSLASTTAGWNTLRKNWSSSNTGKDPAVRSWRVTSERRYTFPSWIFLMPGLRCWQW